MPLEYDNILCSPTLSTILNNNIDCFCRREKEAFEKLISEKSGMVIPEDREGKDSMLIPEDREGKDCMLIVDT